jgi:predicted nucleic acid-binding protein
VIYVDSSVVLAQLLAEDRSPTESFWETSPLVSSRLLEYEVWNRIHGRGLGMTHGEDVRALLARALDPFPTTVWTLDALHLASVEFLRGLGQRPALATYDVRLAEAATALAIPLADVDARGSTD